MLARLHIHNLALIERAELELGPGLNVLTGETGAGKTMLAQAIGLLTGAQPVAGMVGPHGDEAYVEAEFDAPPELFDDPALAAVAGLRPDGEEALVVARRLTANGRSRAFVWGRGAPGPTSRPSASGSSRCRPSTRPAGSRARPAQLELLDAHAGTADLEAEMADAWRALRAAAAAFESARGEAADAARRRLDLEDLVARVDALAPAPASRRRSRAERERLRHLDELPAAAACRRRAPEPRRRPGRRASSHRERCPGGRGRHRVRARAGAMSPRPSTRSALRIQDASAELRGHLAGLEADPARLEHVEARLDSLRPARAPVCGAARRGASSRRARARRALERLESSHRGARPARGRG